MSTKPIEIKPTTFARGVPKEEHNGFYGDGLAEKLLGLPMDTQITAVVTFRLDDDIVKKGRGVRYPVLAMDHIEPIWDDERKAAVEEQRDEEYSERTGMNQLDFSGVTESADS
jgi:hypothetical protein